MATKKTHVQKFDFDVTKATEEELSKIRNTIVEGLVIKASKPGGPQDMRDSHDRHYSTHSSG